MHHYTYIHVDRFAICILDRRVISFNEDSLDELRCSDTLLLGSAFARNLASEEERDCIPVKALFPTPPDPRTAMLYSLRRVNC